VNGKRDRTSIVPVVRLAGRCALALVVVAVLGVIAMQFEGIVAKNIAVANELSAVRADVTALHARETRQRATIARLGTARGAIPEIHQKLRLVGPHEEIIYLRGTGVPTPEPDSYGTER
jgi:hypothetical protein